MFSVKREDGRAAMLFLQSAATVGVSSLEGVHGGTRDDPLDLAHHLGMDRGHAIHVEAVRGRILFGRLDSNRLEEEALADPILDRRSVYVVAGADRRKVWSACQSRVKAGAAAGGHCSTDRQYDCVDEAVEDD